jgi:hypothetical protein
MVVAEYSCIDVERIEREPALFIGEGIQPRGHLATPCHDITHLRLRSFPAIAPAKDGVPVCHELPPSLCQRRQVRDDRIRIIGVVEDAQCPC